MRHLVKTKKFKRTEEERKRLWIDLSRALIKNKKIVTFSARAKWFAPKFERLVTLVKRADGNVKLAFSKVRPFLSEDIARILIEDVVPKLKGRDGGYTSILKMGTNFSEHDKSVVMIVDEIKTSKTKTAAAADTKTEVKPSSSDKTEVVVKAKTVETGDSKKKVVKKKVEKK